MNYGASCAVWLRIDKTTVVNSEAPSPEVSTHTQIVQQPLWALYPTVRVGLYASEDMPGRPLQPVCEPQRELRCSPPAEWATPHGLLIPRGSKQPWQCTECCSHSHTNELCTQSMERKRTPLGPFVPISNTGQTMAGVRKPP